MFSGASAIWKKQLEKTNSVLAKKRKTALAGTGGKGLPTVPQFVVAAEAAAAVTCAQNCPALGGRRRHHHRVVERLAVLLASG